MLLAYQVMDSSAALLNDRALSNFTYAAQMPYLNMALRELKELCELNNIPVSNKSEIDIEVPAGSTTIEFNALAPEPALPVDLIEPLELYERNSGTTQDFIPMTRTQFLPTYNTQVSNLIYWSWLGQKIKLIGATNDIEVRIDYTKDIFPTIVDKDESIDMINAQSFLQYRTASLCAEFIGENKERADTLNQYSLLSLDRVLGIGIKGGQSIATRRRPFNQTHKLLNNSL